MFKEIIDESYIIYQNGTSEGTQIKYKKNGFWYKKDNRGNEGLVEYLVSKLLTFTDLNPKEYVIYEQGMINGLSGCRSKDFLKKDEELITIYRLYFNEYGKDLSKVIAKMDEMEERIEYVIEFVKESCKLDITEYLSKLFTLDMLVLNEDRHLNNMAVICKEDTFRPAPIFDQGVSLLTANVSVNWKQSIRENVKKVIARPFSGSFEKQQKYFGNGFSLDVESAVEWLKDERDSKEKEVLLYQLDKYKKLLM